MNRMKTDMKTVRVRGAVAVDEKGRYLIVGDDSIDDATMAHRVKMFGPRGNFVVHFIEADIPIPEVQTVQAKVAK